MELKDRINAVLSYTQLNASAFAKTIGVKTTQAVYDLLAGKTKTLSSDILTKIVSCYPALSVEWLVTGEGEMIKPSVQQISHGEHSPNLYGSNNNVGDAQAFERVLAELAEERKLVARTLAMLEKRDAQIDRLISLLENKS